MILVTGGAGFIGANFVLDWLCQSGEAIVNIGKLTCAGNPGTSNWLRGNAKHVPDHVDICDRAGLYTLFAKCRPRAVVHFATESHVDRLIHGATDFVQTKVADAGKAAFRLLHISTNDVSGSPSATAEQRPETTPYALNSPYSASKAGSDQLVRASRHSRGMPTSASSAGNLRHVSCEDGSRVSRQPAMGR
jgi:dTDP-glucose 4,6-dehydratase